MSKTSVSKTKRNVFVTVDGGKIEVLKPINGLPQFKAIVDPTYSVGVSSLEAKLPVTFATMSAASHWLWCIHSRVEGYRQRHGMKHSSRIGASN
jgi:hypothetical protein